ncbi:DUF3899 domain-containing protein [Sporosarcina sp. HYO08]|uniref:DUF3899 domain-containing protein n=1 Tax=Sporosarcina sp. HYO08 TaxID=1759557 RepID=UPI000794F402|nr:DUF3899 domain-containing protein [Sporosarcina sp. HYO08]KXH79777.1 hypothetical protein AU377_09830 [Sporosarcina sp. HYO08]
MNAFWRNFIIENILIIGLLFFYFKQVTLLSYINASFVVGGLVVFAGLISYIFSTGFFDVFTVSMRKVITPKHMMEQVKSMRTPSEIFSGSVASFLGSGLAVLAMTGIALILFYL